MLIIRLHRKLRHRALLRAHYLQAPLVRGVIFAADIMQEAMDWRDYIHSDPEILSSKPVVKGTRLSVEFLLELFAVGWSEQQVLEGYPNLTQESLRVVFAFAAESARDERTFELHR